MHRRNPLPHIVSLEMYWYEHIAWSAYRNLLSIVPVRAEISTPWAATESAEATGVSASGEGSSTFVHVEPPSELIVDR